MSDNNEIIIVGGGVIGCSIAYHLGMQGYAATIIERESVAARSSGKAWAVMGPTGALRLFEMDPPEVSMFHSPEGESVAHWIELFNNSYTRISDVAADLKSRGGMDIELSTCPIDILAFNEKEDEILRSDLELLNKLGFWELFWVGRSIPPSLPCRHLSGPV